jgi:hypothetical protein
VMSPSSPPRVLPPHPPLTRTNGSTLRLTDSLYPSQCLVLLNPRWISRHFALFVLAVCNCYQTYYPLFHVSCQMQVYVVVHQILVSHTDTPSQYSVPNVRHTRRYKNQSQPVFITFIPIPATMGTACLQCLHHCLWLIHRKMQYFDHDGLLLL